VSVERLGRISNSDDQQIADIGDRSVRHLTPRKLAAFYKAVGGDYDCETSCPGFQPSVSGTDLSSSVR
jgi:hypothetical protein